MARLLVADDRADVRRLLRRLLEPDHEVAEAADGDEALALLCAAPPDVAILDVDMPGLTGIEVCRRIRADPRFGAVKLVIMTASGVEDEASAARAGADAFLAKPFRSAQVTALIDSLVAAGPSRPA